MNETGFYECVETGYFLILGNNSSSKQKKKRNLAHPFVDIGKNRTCAKSQQQLLKSMAVVARQSFQFFRQNTWLLENNRVLSEFLSGILNSLISITNL